MKDQHGQFLPIRVVPYYAGQTTPFDDMIAACPAVETSRPQRAIRPRTPFE